MRDQLLAMIVVAGAVAAGWMVVSGTGRHKRGRRPTTDGSSGGDGGDWNWLSGHSHSGDHGSGGDSGGDSGSDGGGGDGGGGGD